VTSEHYWSIDFPGLNGVDAQRICDLVRESGLAYDGIPADPDGFLTLHMDRSTVETLAEALARARTTVGVQSLSETLDVWPSASRGTLDA
jgi:hypothetical protein